MSNRADGRYPGNVVAAYVAEDVFDAGGYVLKLDVNLEGGGAVTCRQALKADNDGKRDAVLKALDLSFPLKSVELAALKGKGIDVNLKTSKKGNQNAYVATMREERVLTPEEIDAMAAVAVTNDDLPF